MLTPLHAFMSQAVFADPTPIPLLSYILDILVSDALVSCPLPKSSKSVFCLLKRAVTVVYIKRHRCMRV